VHLEDIIDEDSVSSFEGQRPEGFGRESFVALPSLAHFGPARLEEEGELVVFDVLCERV
jgi:hypothetical protein